MDIEQMQIDIENVREELQGTKAGNINIAFIETLLSRIEENLAKCQKSKISEHINHSSIHNNDFKKVPLTPETPRVFGYQCPKCIEIVGKWEVKNHVCSELIPKS